MQSFYEDSAVKLWICIKRDNDFLNSGIKGKFSAAGVNVQAFMVFKHFYTHLSMNQTLKCDPDHSCDHIK